MQCKEIRAKDPFYIVHTKVWQQLNMNMNYRGRLEWHLNTEPAYQLIQVSCLWLVTWGYPKALVERTAATVSYKDEAQLFQQSRPPQPKYYPPLYKCSPPPWYKLLKQIVLENYHPLQKVLHPSEAHNTQQWAGKNPTLSNKWTTHWHPHRPQQPHYPWLHHRRTTASTPNTRS